MKSLILVLSFLMVACGPKSKVSEVAQNPTSLDLPKMSCETVGQNIECSNSSELNGVPEGCNLYTSGTRLFLNNTLASADAYDCGERFQNGLRCFYFVHMNSATDGIEDVICQPGYDSP